MLTDLLPLKAVQNSGGGCTSRSAIQMLYSDVDILTEGGRVPELPVLFVLRNKGVFVHTWKSIQNRDSCMTAFTWKSQEPSLIKDIVSSLEKHSNHTYTFYSKLGCVAIDPQRWCWSSTSFDQCFWLFFLAPDPLKIKLDRPSPEVILSLLSVGFKSFQVDKYPFFTRENKLNCEKTIDILCIKHDISLGKPWKIKILSNIFPTVPPHWNAWEIIDLIGSLT